jgi:hypothetical protein
VNFTIFGFSATLLNFFLAAAMFWYLSVAYSFNRGRGVMGRGRNSRRRARWRDMD